MGTGRECRWGWNEDGNGGRGSGRKQRGQRGPGGKRSPLVVDVLEYWEVYERDSADYIRHL